MANKLRWGTAWLLVCLARAAAAQTPLGGEFRVNEFTTGYQRNPSVAADASGNFLVVWSSDDQDADVFGRLYDANGNARGPEFQLNEDNAFGQHHPDAAFDAAGNFVVVWASFGQDGSTQGVFGRRFDATGQPLTGEFQVNTYTFNYQAKARVAAGVNGEFVVVWQSVGEDGSESGIFGQRFNGAGTKLGPAFQVNTYTTDEQDYPAVAADAQGNFVVVWESLGQNTGGGPNHGIYAQRYDAAGNRLGGEFRANTVTLGNQVFPSVAREPSGSFTLAWASSDPDSFGVWARRYDAQGTPSGAEFPVNTYTTDAQFFQSVALDANANLVAAWESNLQDGSNYGIAARQVSCDGQGVGSDFVVNTYTTGYQARPRVAAWAGSFVVTWVSRVQDGSMDGVFARRYRGASACGRFHAVAPCRLADTRNPAGPSGGPALGANTERSFPIAGGCGIPADARAVALNLTTTGQTDRGDLRVYPGGGPAPLASAINFVANHARANTALVRLGVNGMISVRCDMPAGSAGATHLVLDTYGYFK